jgi:hypothetical protein
MGKRKTIRLKLQRLSRPALALDGSVIKFPEAIYEPTLLLF